MRIITEIQPVRGGLFKNEPMPNIDSSFVYTNKRGKYRLITGKDYLTRSEMNAERYSMRYTVLEETYSYQYEDESSSKELGRTFKVRIQLKVKVKDPIAIVQNDIKDIRHYLDMKIDFWMRSITEEHSIEEIIQVKNKFRNIKEQTNISYDLKEVGFEIIELHGQVDLSESDEKYVKEKQKIRQQGELDRDRLEAKQKLDSMKNEKENEERDKLIDKILRSDSRTASILVAENKKEILVILEQIRQEELEDKRKKEEHQRNLEEKLASKIFTDDMDARERINVWQTVAGEAPQKELQNEQNVKLENPKTWNDTATRLGDTFDEDKRTKSAEGEQTDEGGKWA
ncbi:hypothetical protein [Priestia megaterium]